jgi:3-oxoacyl-[acyl-carrier protein] reductase
MLHIDLSKKIAVVSGGSGELGRVIVRVLARCGADVAIHYFRHAERARLLLEGLQSLGVRGMTVQADVTRPTSVAAMHEAVVHTLGPPHILVNNPVIQYEPWINVLEQPLADYESQFRSSVLQNVLTAKAFVPDMIRNHYGRFIAISTECVMQSLPGQSAYMAGKRGMDGMLRVLAKEIGPYQITVKQVAPGWTITERVRNEGTPRQDAYEVTVPLKRRGEDQEVAQVVAFLASDLASYITGAYIPDTPHHWASRDPPIDPHHFGDAGDQEVLVIQDADEAELAPFGQGIAAALAVAGGHHQEGGLRNEGFDRLP